MRCPAGLPSSGFGDAPLQQLQQSARHTAAPGAPQARPGSSPEGAGRGAGAPHPVRSPRDLPLRHSPRTLPDAGGGVALASSGGSSSTPAPQAPFRHEPPAIASACLAGDTDTAPQQLLHPSGPAAAASCQAGAAPPSLLYRDGSGASGGGLGQGSHGSSSVSSLSSLGQGAYAQSSPAHRGEACDWCLVSFSGSAVLGDRAAFGSLMLWCFTVPPQSPQQLLLLPPGLRAMVRCR